MEDYQSLVESRDDVIENLITLYSYKENPKYVNDFVDIQKQGRQYVFDFVDNRLCFGPSKFIGYKHNRLELRGRGSGSYTNTRFRTKQHFGDYKEVKEGDAEYVILSKAIKNMLADYGEVWNEHNHSFFIDKSLTIEQIQNALDMKMKSTTMIHNYTKILEQKKNLILQGAPGTGKTYTTAALALSICGEAIPEKHEDVMKRYEELRKEGRIAFCTFHQSMDYEDFVEGIKPKTENGTITYEVEDGIFKEISDRACINFEDSQKTIEVLQKQKNVQDKINEFLSDAQETRQEYQTKTGSKFVISDVTDKNIVVEVPENQITSKLLLKLSDLTALLENEVPLNNVKDIKTYFNRKFNAQQDSYIFVIVKEINKIKNKTVSVSKTELQNFVLIIDEINRGNVSKVFGELITLLEADKRIGRAHPIKVVLPYSKEEFGVPSNLYIIGTMNTTDRSVGNIDYAVRRRFAFVTLKADRQILVGKYGEDSKQVQLFDKVSDFLNDDKKHVDMDFEDLMVGHSYFMAKDAEELKLKLEYEIIPLIEEYQKDGIINVKKEELEKEFENWRSMI